MAVVSKNGVVTVVSLDFGKWFYQEKEIQNIEEVDGIYIAHAGMVQVENGKEVFFPDRVIYIGKATGTDNVHVRVSNHKSNDHPKWKKHLKSGEQILYSYAECPRNIICDVEAALIYKNKPLENSVSKDRYTGNTHFISVKVYGEAIGTLKESGLVL